MQIQPSEVKVIHADVTHWITYCILVEESPGVYDLGNEMFSDYQEVPSREHSHVQLPPLGVAYRFHDSVKIQCEIKGAKYTLEVDETGGGDAEYLENPSPWYFPGGSFVAAKDAPEAVREEAPRRFSGQWIKTRFGTYHVADRDWKKAEML